MHLHYANDPCKFINFSGATYQLQLEDADNPNGAWTYLQLDAQGNLIDGFCDQEETEGFSPCTHIQQAIQRIFNGNTQPLHVRFENSLWNRLCRLSEERLGDDPDCLT